MAAAAAAGEMVWARLLEEGVFRFDASEAARAAAGPSLSFADPRRREAPREGADAPAVVPAFEAAPGGAQRVVLKVRGRRRRARAAYCGPLVWFGCGVRVMRVRGAFGARLVSFFFICCFRDRLPRPVLRVDGWSFGWFPCWLMHDGERVKC